MSLPWRRWCKSNRSSAVSRGGPVRRPRRPPCRPAVEALEMRTLFSVQPLSVAAFPGGPVTANGATVLSSVSADGRYVLFTSTDSFSFRPPPTWSPD